MCVRTHPHTHTHTHGGDTRHQHIKCLSRVGPKYIVVKWAQEQSHPAPRRPNTHLKRA